MVVQKSEVSTVPPAISTTPKLTPTLTDRERTEAAWSSKTTSGDSKPSLLPAKPSVVLPGQTVLAKVADEPVGRCLLGLGSLLLICVGVASGNSVVAGWGVLMAGLLVLLRLVGDMKCGVTSSNWGTWQRSQQGIGYFCNLVFWGVVTASLFGVGVLALFGIVQVPTP
jgi:hypothetical protein